MEGKNYSWWEQWKLIIDAFLRPMSVVLIGGGIGFSLLAARNPTSAWFIGGASILIGLGANHIYFHYRKFFEDQKLKEKAEFTSRNLNDICQDILDKASLTPEEMSIVRRLFTVIDYWKDFFPPADMSIIAQLADLKKRKDSAVKPEEKKVLAAEEMQLEYKIQKSGMSSFQAASGSFDVHTTKDGRTFFSLGPRTFDKDKYKDKDKDKDKDKED